jgi:hypothetical protein
MIQSCGQLSLLKKTSRVVWLFTIALLVSADACDDQIKISKPSSSYKAPSHVQIELGRVKNTTSNLADLVEAACKGTPAESLGNKVAMEARDAVTAINQAIVSDGPTGAYYNNGGYWIDQAAKAAARAYNLAKDCGGVPPDVPNIPGYSETFWEIAS